MPENSNIREFGPNEIVFLEGEPGEEMYVIKSGKILVQKRAGAEMVPLATLGPGAIIGEMSLLDKQPRSATAKTLERTVLVAVTQDILEATYSQMPGWFASIFRVLTSRLRETTRKKYAHTLARAYPSFIKTIILFCHQNEGVHLVPATHLTWAMEISTGLKREDVFALGKALEKLEFGKLIKEESGFFIEVEHLSHIEFHYDYLLSHALQHEDQLKIETVSSFSRQLLKEILPVAREHGESKSRQIIIPEDRVRELFAENDRLKSLFREESVQELGAHKLMNRITGAQNQTLLSFPLEEVEPALEQIKILPKISGMQLEDLFL